MNLNMQRDVYLSMNHTQTWVPPAGKINKLRPLVIQNSQKLPNQWAMDQK